MSPSSVPEEAESVRSESQSNLIHYPTYTNLLSPSFFSAPCKRVYASSSSFPSISRPLKTSVIKRASKSVTVQQNGMWRFRSSRWWGWDPGRRMLTHLSRDLLQTLAVDLLNPSAESEKRKHKLKRLVQSPNSYFMDVKCPG